MRIRDWRIALAALLVAAAAAALFGAQGPILTHPDPDIEREFQHAYGGIQSNTSALAASRSFIHTAIRGLKISNISATGNHVLWDWALLKDSSGNIFVSDAPGSIVTTSIASSGAVNKLDTGTVAASKWYYVWLISNGTTTGALYSLSATAPTLPSGYTYKKIIGTIRTDVAGAIIETLQIDDTVYYSLMAYQYTDTTNIGTSVDVDISSAIPPLVTWQAYVYGVLTANYSVATQANMTVSIGGEFGGISPGSGIPVTVSQVGGTGTGQRTGGANWMPIFNESVAECRVRANFAATATNRSSYEFDLAVLGYKLNFL